MEKKSIKSLEVAKDSLKASSGQNRKLAQGISSCFARIRNTISDPNKGSCEALYEALILTFNPDSPVGNMCAESENFKKFLNSIPGFEHFNTLIKSNKNYRMKFIDQHAPHPKKFGFIDNAIQQILDQAVDSFLKDPPSLSRLAHIVQIALRQLSPEDKTQGVVITYLGNISPTGKKELKAVIKGQGLDVFDNKKDYEAHTGSRCLLSPLSKISKDGVLKENCGLKVTPYLLLFIDSEKIPLGIGKLAEEIRAP